MCDSVPRAPSCLDRLAFSFEGRKPCILNGLKKQTSGHGAHPGAFASLTLHGSTNSTHQPEFPETASAFTPQQLWLQKQLGKIPVFARFAEQAKEQAREHREMKETERVWKGQVVKESKAPLQPPVTKKKKKKVMVNRPKDLSVSDGEIMVLTVQILLTIFDSSPDLGFVCGAGCGWQWGTRRGRDLCRPREDGASFVTYGGRSTDGSV